jgi:hypothetical protein
MGPFLLSTGSVYVGIHRYIFKYSFYEEVLKAMLPTLPRGFK